MTPPPPPPRTPSRYNLRRRPSTATPVPRTPRMLQRLGQDAEEQLRQHPPSEPRLLRSANKKRPVTADPSVSVPTPQPRRPSTAPLAAVPQPSSPSQSSLPSSQPVAAEPNVSTPPIRPRRPSRAPPSDRVLRSSSRTRRRDQSQEPIQSSSRKSDVSRPQPASTKRLTARARAFLPHPLNSDKPEAVDNARDTATQRRRGRSSSKTHSRPPQIESSVPKRERSRSRSQVRTIRTRSQSNVKPADNISTENNVSPNTEGLDGTMRRLFHGAQRFQSSSPDFSKWQYQDLVEECKKNGLPCRGKKDEVVNRLQRFHTRSAGALARRTAMETKRSVRSRANKSDHQETVQSNVSSPKLLSEREEVINPAGDQGKGYVQDSNEMDIEDKTDVAAPEQHIEVREDKELLRFGQDSHAVIQYQNDNETCGNAEKTVSETNAGESPGLKEEKGAEKRNSSDVPLVKDKEDENPSLAENSREQVSELNVHQSYESNHTQQGIPVDIESKPTQQGLAKEHLYSGVPLKNENEHLSMHCEKPESHQEHTSDLEENEASSSFRQEPSDSKHPDCLSSSKVGLENVPLAPRSKDKERDAQPPHETPASSAAQPEGEVISLAEEKISEPSISKSYESHHKDIEDKAKTPEVAVDDQTNSVQKVCQRINNVGAIQFEPAKEHILSPQTPMGPLNIEANESHSGNQLDMAEAKDGPSAHDMPTREPQSSLLECQGREQQVRETDKAFEPQAAPQAAPQSPPHPEPQETVTQEMFSRWRRPPIERKDEVVQTPDVIDLDAESDGNDDDEEEDSRHCNSDSNENSGDETQRPETVVPAEEEEEEEEEDDGDDDDDDDDDDNQTPRRDDVIGNKLPDTDEDNDEDEDDDERSDANDDSSRSDACELTAEEGEGPQPMDVTLSEQGEERQATDQLNHETNIAAIKTTAHDNDNCEDIDESKASTVDGTALLSQRVVAEPKESEQVKTVHTAEQDRDEVIDLQEDSRMGEDEEDDEELDYADNIVNLDDALSDRREKICSATGKGKKDSTSRANAEESDAALVLGSSEVHGKEEQTARDVVEPSSLNDTAQKAGVVSDEFGEEINAEHLSSQDLKNDGIYLSVEEIEVDDRDKETSAAQKGLIKPELRGENMWLSEKEGDINESGEGNAVAQKGEFNLNDVREEGDKKEEQEYEMPLSHSLETRETAEPDSANLEERESAKFFDVGINPTGSSKVQRKPSKSIEEDRNDDLGEFSESPLPSPNPPRSHSEGREGDYLPKSMRQIVSEDYRASVVEDKNESETPEGGSQGENAVQYQSETLDENYPSSDIIRADEDMSQSIAELGSDEEQSPSEDLSSRVGDPDIGQNEQERIPTSGGSSPEVHDLTGNLSSDPSQEQGGYEDPNVGQSHQYGRITTSRGSSSDVRDNRVAGPGQDQRQIGRESEEPPDMICIISSDDDEPVAETSTGAAIGKAANKIDTYKEKKQGINDGLEKLENEGRHVRDISLKEFDLHQHTRPDVGLVSSKLELENRHIAEYDDVHLPKTSLGNQGAPLPTSLLHKTSQTASRNGDVGGFRIPAIQRSDSAFSASLKRRASFKETEKLPPLDPMLSRQHKAELPWVKAPREFQTSTRLNSDMIQRRELDDNNDYKVFESDILPQDPNLAENQITTKAALYGKTGKRPFDQVQEFCNEDQRPRKVRKKQNMVEFVPMPTPESTIQAFGQQRMMKESHDTPHHEQKSSLILDRLRKIQEVEHQGPSLTFRLPPLTATLGQLYNSQQHECEPVMFRQGSITSVPKKSVRRHTARGIPEFDKKSFMEESRKRLEAHKRRAPSLQPSRDPFVAPPTVPSGSQNNMSSRSIPRQAKDRRPSQVHIPGPTKRVTFQTEIPPSKRRRGTTR